uniref:2'-phosphotransferase n=1 Tax=Varanus komodoensis TaxID=61221 RepID=A0A8D2KUP7_VARKO
MGSDGFVDVAEVLRLPQFKAWSLDDVQRVVEMNEKQRFAVRPHPSTGHLQIRANQGHSLPVSELELTPLLDPSDFPEVVAHGTYLRHWTAIRRSGLSRMGRTHIHLAPGLPGDGTVVSGERSIPLARQMGKQALNRLLPDQNWTSAKHTWIGHFGHEMIGMRP